jgi:hypothetical protein
MVKFKDPGAKVQRYKIINNHKYTLVRFQDTYNRDTAPLGKWWESSRISKNCKSFNHFRSLVIKIVKYTTTIML